MFGNIGDEGIVARALVFGHPEEGDDGLIKSLHVLGEGGVLLLAFLPVTAHDRLDIPRRGIIKIDRQTLLGGLFLDLGQDFGLLLGEVGVGCGLVFLPQGGQYMAVGVGRLGKGEGAAHHGGCQK